MGAADDARADQPLLEQIIRGLHDAADPARAPQMQAYMKSTMPYLGVAVPRVRSITRQAVRVRPPSTATLVPTVRALWFTATHRECRYAATAILDAPAARPLRLPEHIGLCRDLIVSGAWWDHVDELSHRVGDLLQAFPDEVRPVVQAWQRDPDRWLRRSSIICQLGMRERTDVELLSTTIDASTHDADFFIRKAIGWALRDYARTDPSWVRGFVDEHDMSPLSRREALKHL